MSHPNPRTSHRRTPSTPPHRLPPVRPPPPPPPPQAGTGTAPKRQDLSAPHNTTASRNMPRGPEQPRRARDDGREDRDRESRGRAHLRRVDGGARREVDPLTRRRGEGVAGAERGLWRAVAMSWRNDLVRSGGVWFWFCGTLSWSWSWPGLLRWRGEKQKQRDETRGPEPRAWGRFVPFQIDDEERGPGQSRREATEPTRRDSRRGPRVDACRGVPCAARVYQT